MVMRPESWIAPVVSTILVPMEMMLVSDVQSLILVRTHSLSLNITLLMFLLELFLNTVGAGCATGDIRLAGTGRSSAQGRVEVCNDNQWGTICDDVWDNVDATVVCTQLGYSDLGMSA